MIGVTVRSAIVVCLVMSCQPRSSVPTATSSRPPAPPSPATSAAPSAAPSASHEAPAAPPSRVAAVPSSAASATTSDVVTVPLKLSQSPSEGGLLAVRDTDYCTKLLSCAITPQRTVVCWSPTLSKQLPLSDITQLVAGDLFHCALDAKGKVVCWESNECGSEAERDAIEEVQHGLGPLKAIFAGGHTLCLTPAKGRTECRRPNFPREPTWTVPSTIRAVTAACFLAGNGLVRCDLGTPRGGWPRVGPVVFPGAFRDVVEGGFNPGYYGVQHCAIDTAGAVACCKGLFKCKKHVFERKTFPSPAVELVGANTFVAARLENGDVHAWTSTIRIARVPFDLEPSGRVTALSKTLEIAGGRDMLCARLQDGHVACIGGGFGKARASLVQVAAP